MKSPNPYDLFVWLAAFVVGNKFAESAGPYLLLLVCTTAGAYVALGRREPGQKPAGVPFLLIVNVISIAFTSVLTAVLSSRFPSFEERATFAPIALAIGYVGLDYPVLLPYLYNKYLEWRTGGSNAK